MQLLFEHLNLLLLSVDQALGVLKLHVSRNREDTGHLELAAHTISVKISGAICVDFWGYGLALQ